MLAIKNNEHFLKISKYQTKKLLYADMICKNETLNALIGKR